MISEVLERKTALLAAGGTGGHVFPAEALARELAGRGWRLVMVTDQRGSACCHGMEDVQVYTVLSAKMMGQSLWGRLFGLISLARGLLQARRIIQSVKPDIVIGFGGYASVPTVAAGLFAMLPVIVHEQNAILGRANRLFARFLKTLATAYDDVKYVPSSVPVIRVGMPVRDEVRALGRLPYRPPSEADPIYVLILGGSQGARILTDVLPHALSRLPGNMKSRLSVSHQARPEDVSRATEMYRDAQIQATVSSFFTDVPQRLERSHLVIARSGASTVAEVTVAGRPAIFIPYPAAADNHQMANAQAVERVGGAVVLPQDILNSETMADICCRLISNMHTLVTLSSCAVSWAVPDAARRLGDVVENAVQNKVSP